jgi:hypothetical protein
MTTRQTRHIRRLRKLLVTAVSSGLLPPDIVEWSTEFLVTGYARGVRAAPLGSELAHAVWYALLRSRSPWADVVSDSLTQLHKALRAEGITV